MSALTNVLRHITKKAAHPNTLLYNVQLERAKNKYLLRGQLGDGLDGTVALDAPKEDDGIVKIETEESSKEERFAMQNDMEDMCRVNGNVKRGEVGKDGGIRW